MHQTIGIPLDATTPNAAVNVLKQQGLAVLDELPPFSPILNKLMASLNAEDVSFVILGDLIEKDAVLAGRLLGVANSEVYTRRVSSVRHALSLLGTEKVRSTVLEMSVACKLDPARTPPGWSMERFNKHSAAVAILSDLVAQRTAVESPEDAFVAGLLHDIGRLLIAIGLPQEFQTMLSEYKTTGLSWIECEQKTLGFTHPELSRAALAAWRVAEPIQRAASEHHNPVAPHLGEVMSLGWVVNAANQYINSLGESILPGRKPDAAGTVWMESLGLDTQALKLLFEDFREEHSAMAQFFH